MKPRWKATRGLLTGRSVALGLRLGHVDARRGPLLPASARPGSVTPPPAPGVTATPPARALSALAHHHARGDSLTRRNATVDSALVLDRTLQVQWVDGHTSYYDFVWLRVNCPSFLHESGQRTVFPGDVDADLRPREVTTPDSTMSVSWTDGHVSVYNADWLRAHDNSPSALHERDHGSWPTPLCAWDAIPKVDGAAYMHDDEALYKALRKVNRSGVCILDGMGTKEGTVLDIARRVACISHQTLYGDVFDVVFQERPRNIAYSGEELRLHMDLVYYESPPGLQFLHCLEFDEGVKGGESTFMDAFAAADHFRSLHPGMFEVLCKIPATFQKVRAAASPAEKQERNTEAQAPAYMECQRPHFQVDSNGSILGVNWAPMFEGALMCATQDVAPYYEAYRAFQHLIEGDPYAKDHTVRARLTPGQCLVFNNRRLLHGREAVDVSKGLRLLQGCYVNIDDAMSRLRSLHVDQPPRHIPVENQLKRPGNGSLALVEY